MINYFCTEVLGSTLQYLFAFDRNLRTLGSTIDEFRHLVAFQELLQFILHGLKLHCFREVMLRIQISA